MHMIKDYEPDLVLSARSQRVLVDNHPFSIEIYRLQTEGNWTLEVVDADGTSHVWDGQFPTDEDAMNTALNALHGEGAEAFMTGDTVVNFRRT